ncbi:6-carboxytetrahydropterin synthase [Streptomyces sp. NPDC087440]|uniref:6-carboxytetrahydropterin synthase n=1 Tax=Streptomyces sp. NPDC087440 TaxID=3365790 RepID=UPI00381212FE
MLTAVHEYSVPMHHLMPKLPSWHICSRTHMHEYTVTIACSAPDHQFTPEISDLLAVARAEIERNLRYGHINDLGGSWQPSADHATLAKWVHATVTSRLPKELAPAVTVQVTLREGKSPRVFPEGRSIPKWPSTSDALTASSRATTTHQ